MKNIQTGLLRDVRKYDGCAVHKATCRDGARLGVLDRGPCRAGRDSHICRRRRPRLRLLAVYGNRANKNHDRKKKECARGQAAADAMDPLCGNRSHRKLANLPEKGTPDSMGHDGSSESGWSIAHRERKRIMGGIILSQPACSRAERSDVLSGHASEVSNSRIWGEGEMNPARRRCRSAKYSSAVASDSSVYFCR